MIPSDMHAMSACAGAEFHGDLMLAHFPNVQYFTYHPITCTMYMYICIL